MIVSVFSPYNCLWPLVEKETKAPEISISILLGLRLSRETRDIVTSGRFWFESISTKIEGQAQWMRSKGSVVHEFTQYSRNLSTNFMVDTQWHLLNPIQRDIRRLLSWLWFTDVALFSSVIHSLLTLHMDDHNHNSINDINERIKDKHGMMVKD